MSRFHLRSSVLVIPLLCILNASWAQTVRVFNTDNGLPHNRVNRIYRDSKDFLWICTDDGLSRFDGHQFVNYTKSHGLPHAYVNAVLETRTGEFWVATDGGVSRFDPRGGRTLFTTYAPSVSAESRHVNALSEEQDGSLLLGTAVGLYRFRPHQNSGTFEPIDFGAPLGTPVSINAIAQDTNGSIWLGTNHGLYQRGANAGWTHYGTESGLSVDRWTSTESTAFVNSFAEDRDGRLWVAFKGGFGRIAMAPRPGSQVLDFVVRTTQTVLGRSVRALWFGSDGRRWIATESGLREWELDSNGMCRFREQAIQDRFPREAFLSIREDAAGNLWVGTRRSGLLHMSSSRLQTFGASEGLRLALDQTLLNSKSGHVSVFDLGGKRAQLYVWEGGTRFRVIRPALPELGASGLQTAIEDHTGAWWFSTASGLLRFPTLRGQSDLHLLAECEVDRFFEDSAGDIWMNYRPQGEVLARLARWERRSGQVYDETQRLPADARAGIAAFAQDPSGTLWVALQLPGGLLRLKEGRFQRLSADWRGHINQLFADSKGRLWVTSTQSGLGLIAAPLSFDPQLRRYTKAQGLTADEVWCVTEDQFGRIYAGVANGVDRLDPDTDRIVHYSSADGLVRGDIRSALRDRNGDLWFASAYGISKFKPGADRSVPPARVRITGLRSGGVAFPLSEFGQAEIGPLRLPSHQNSLQVDFAATDYRVLAPLRYQFWLDRDASPGDSANWQDLGTTSTVHLLDLAPGSFNLKLRALTPDGLPGEPASLTFAVLQPYWRTWWFQLASVLAIAVVAYWVRTRRLHQQLAMERIRSHIAMDLHDDIGAGLSRISVVSEALKNRWQPIDDQGQKMLEDIAGSSRQLVADMSDIVWSLDPRRDQIGELAARLRSFGSSLLEQRGMEWVVEAPEEELHQRIPPDTRRQIYLVFKEAINNIGKHSNAQKAKLRLWFEDGSVCGELVDDGCGFAPVGTHGNGLGSMQARVQQMAGNFNISTPAGSGGTSIRIDVPLPK